MKRKVVSILIIMSLFVFSGCVKNDNLDNGNKKRIRIMAAASLTEIFTFIEKDFEQKNKNMDIEFNFAGSQVCTNQILEGIDTDIFASANSKYINQLQKKGIVKKENVNIFAENKLIIIVNKDSKSIKSLEDIIKKDIKIVIAHESVPAGIYTLRMLEKVNEDLQNYKSKFINNVVSMENNIKAVAMKIELGEADCGIVYKTDVTIANKDSLNIIEIPREYNVVATYPIAMLNNSKNKSQARLFLNYVFSKEGKAVLKQFGFN